MTVAMAQLSLVMAGSDMGTWVAVKDLLSALTVTVAGQVIDGGWLSTTMTCCVQLLALRRMRVTVRGRELSSDGYLADLLLMTVAMAQLSLVLAGTPRATPVAAQEPVSALRAEEGGVGKEGRSRWSP